jgi:hypothetical protein
VGPKIWAGWFPLSGFFPPNGPIPLSGSFFPYSPSFPYSGIFLVEIPFLTPVSLFVFRTTDPLSFRPRLDHLLESGDDQDPSNASVENARIESKPQIYRPPKLTAVSYDDSRVSRDTRRKQSTHVKESRSRLLKDLRDEFDTRPDEIRDNESQDDDPELKRKERYEEEHFVRLPVTRQDRQKKKQQQLRQRVLRNKDFEVGAYTHALTRALFVIKPTRRPWCDTRACVTL